MSGRDPSPFSPRDAVDTNEFEPGELGLTAPGPIPIGSTFESTPLPIDEPAPAMLTVDPTANQPNRSWLGDTGSPRPRRLTVGVLAVVKAVAVVVSGLVVVALVRSVAIGSDNQPVEPRAGVVSAGASPGPADDSEPRSSMVGADSGSSGYRSRFDDGYDVPGSGTGGAGLPVNSATETNTRSSRSTTGASSVSGSSRRSAGGRVATSVAPAETAPVTSSSTTTTVQSTADDPSSVTGSTATSEGSSTSPASGSTATSGTSSPPSSSPSPTTGSGEPNPTTGDTAPSTDSTSPSVTGSPSVTASPSVTGSGTVGSSASITTPATPVTPESDDGDEGDER